MDNHDSRPPGHYGGDAHVDVDGLRRGYETVKALPVAEATKASPLIRLTLHAGKVWKDTRPSGISDTPCQSGANMQDSSDSYD